MLNLKTTYLGLNLRTPLVSSASPLTHDLDGIRALEDAGAAAIVFHTVFEEPLVSASLPTSASDALEIYLDLIRNARESVAVPIIANLRGSTPEGWADFARQLEQAGSDAIECNLYQVPSQLSLPGAHLEQDCVDTVKLVKSAVKIPVAAKLTPYFTSMADMAKRFDDAGVDGLVLFNRFYQPDVNLEAMEIQPSVLLSTAQDLRLPLTWIGILYSRIRASLAATSGVHAAEDVVKLLMVGADVTMLCSALLRNGVRHLRTVEAGLRDWMERHQYASVAQMKGALSQTRCPDPTAFERAQYMNAVKDARHVMVTGREAWRLLTGS
jgi:dihydroorotate dehydrogenase (fumarate)